MKKTFKITLDTEITIDFSAWGLSDAQQKDEYESKKLVINHYLERLGVDEFEISVGTGLDLSLQKNNSSSLFEVMAGLVTAQNDYARSRTIVSCGPIKPRERTRAVAVQRSINHVSY